MTDSNSELDRLSKERDRYRELLMQSREDLELVVNAKLQSQESQANELCKILDDKLWEKLVARIGKYKWWVLAVAAAFTLGGYLKIDQMITTAITGKIDTKIAGLSSAQQTKLDELSTRYSDEMRTIINSSIQGPLEIGKNIEKLNSATSQIETLRTGAAKIDERLTGLSKLITGLDEKDITRVVEFVKKVDGSDNASAIVDQTNAIAGLRKRLDSIESVELPLGTVIGLSVSTQALDGILSSGVWLLCDGRQINASDYPDLHAHLHITPMTASPGQRFLPNLQGKFLRGADGTGKNDHDPDRDPSNRFQSVGSSQNAAPKFARKGFDRKTAYAKKDNSITGIPIDVSTGTEDPRPKNVSVYWLIKAK